MNESKFTGKAELYSKYRPSYPKEFIDHLQSEVGLDNTGIIADIGSGTGKLTKLLLEVGKMVYAVEPNNDMREAAEHNLNKYKNFISVNATAEITTLNDSSVGFITVAQAFHWFDRKKFKEESKRILKPGGKVILVWNTRVLTGEPVKDYELILRKHCPDFDGFSGGRQSALYNEIGIDSEDFHDYFTGGYESKEFSNDQIEDLECFIGGAMSASYTPRKNDENYSVLIDDLTECFNKYATGGMLTVPFITRIYTGTV